MDNRPAPKHLQYLQCATLVAKVMISEDHTYSESEIILARELLEYSWNDNVTDFLDVVAGIAHPGLYVPEAHAALVFKYGEK
jgi:hypothetical protein